MIRLFTRSFGALTSRPYAFKARPWELRDTPSIDVLNAMGSNIMIQARGNEVLRIQPRLNDDVNEEWIDDKTRHALDGLKRQRLTKPLCRQLGESAGKWDGAMSNWRSTMKRLKMIFDEVNAVGSSGKIRAVTGPSADLYSVLAFCDFVEGLGAKCEPIVEHIGHKLPLGNDLPQNYRFNSTIAGLEEADVCLLVGTNIQVDAPLIFARLRKSFLRDNLKMSLIGFRNEFGFPIEQLGLTPETLLNIANGKHSYMNVLKKAQKPVIIVDSSVFDRKDGAAIAAAIELLGESTNLKKINPETKEVEWNGISILHQNANDVGLQDLGRTKLVDLKKLSQESGDLLYLMNVSSEDLTDAGVSIAQLRENYKFIIFQGHHGDELASAADVVLPGGAYTEKTGVYVNMEGRAQLSRHANPPYLLARDDWKIFRALSEVLGKPLPYETIEQLQARLETFVPASSHECLGEIVNKNGAFEVEGRFKVVKDMLKSGVVSPVPFQPVHYDFHLQGHPVARASQIMAKCSRELQALESNFA